MDAKDREVLAATISVDADILLTQNTKHFPRMWMTERGIELLNAGELLTRLAEHFPEKTQAAHQQAVRTSRKPEAEILSTLESIVGESVTDTVRALATDYA